MFLVFSFSMSLGWVKYKPTGGRRVNKTGRGGGSLAENDGALSRDGAPPVYIYIYISGY